MSINRITFLAVLLLSLLPLSRNNPILAPLNPRLSLPSIGLLARDVPPCMKEQYRTLFTIVKSCLATIIACNWTAVHPNIPGPTEPGKAKLMRRFTTMFYSLLAPDLVILWALRQREGARRIKHEVNKSFGLEQLPKKYENYCCFIRSLLRHRDQFMKWSTRFVRFNNLESHGPWTNTHGFYIQMGGFMLYQDRDAPTCVLSHQDLINLVENSDIDIPAISEDEIKDKSKGNSFQKTFAVVQTSFFISDCITRAVNKLPITHLELASVAFASMNFFIYYFWLDKPYEVDVPTPIFLKRNPTTEHPNGHSEYAQALLAAAAETRALPQQRSWILKGLAKDRKNALEKGWFSGVLEFVAICIPVRLCKGFVRPFAKMIDEKQSPPGRLHVRMFSALSCTDTNDNLVKVIPLGLGLGAAFGALHLVAWNFTTFPSEVELWLWRVCAILTTAIPISMIIVVWLSCLVEWRFKTLEGRGRDPSDLLWLFRNIVNYLGLSCLLFIMTPIYLIARSILLVLIFTTLRNLPVAIFREDGGPALPLF